MFIYSFFTQILRFPSSLHPSIHPSIHPAGRAKQFEQMAELVRSGTGDRAMKLHRAAAAGSKRFRAMHKVRGSGAGGGSGRGGGGGARGGQTKRNRKRPPTDGDGVTAKAAASDAD